MRSTSIARQFMVLIVAFAAVVPASISGLTFFVHKSEAAARRISEDSNHRTDALLGVVQSVGQLQSTIQRLLRERDPDNIEKLMDLGQTAAKIALGKIREAGAEREVASVFENLRRANERSTGYLLKGDLGQAQEVLIEESNPALERLTAAIGKVQEAWTQRENALGAEADAARRRGELATFVLAGVVLAGLSGAALSLVRRMTARLNQTIAELRGVAGGAASAALQISQSSQALAQGSSEQAASLELTSASSEEISSMTVRNAENSQSAAEKMNRASQQIADTNGRLEHMVTSMNEINASGGKVSKIIKVIDEISFQTNILAINAAVEAARAGEAGSGFAVVADEVRNLSQRCAQAAGETAELIEDSIGKTKDGKAQLDAIADMFRSITRAAQEVKALLDNVRLASNEQARGIQEVSAALSQMKEVTRKNAASAEQSAAAGEEVSSQSVAMSATVARLASMVSGASRE